LVKDLKEAYPDLNIDGEAAVWSILNTICALRHETFVFVLDEWD
jgi:hypothetical protein